MKLVAKPISSPGRPEKFPPPLMRFLRSNVGSKSRGRSRSSPMFVRKKNTAIETQEPSSPKVTCMGQVRVRRASKKGSAKPGRNPRSGATVRHRCSWIRKSLIFRQFPGKIKLKLCGPVWCKWASFFQFGSFRSFRRKVETGEENEDSSKIGSKFGKEGSQVSEEEDEQSDRKSMSFANCSSSPPKNALLLTRCRSAPYRSSSLASRFWGSPLKSEEPEEEHKVEENREKPTSEMESLSDQESKLDPKIEEKLRFFIEIEGSIKQRISESKTGEEQEQEEGFVRPLILTRCKSEPARIGEKLDPEMNFWKNKRLGITDSCSATVL
ncbi:hypothetical protein UlMin_005885 [Ulmus minor]